MTWLTTRENTNSRYRYLGVLTYWTTKSRLGFSMSTSQTFSMSHLVLDKVESKKKVTGETYSTKMVTDTLSQRVELRTTYLTQSR